MYWISLIVVKRFRIINESAKASQPVMNTMLALILVSTLASAPASPFCIHQPSNRSYAPEETLLTIADACKAIVCSERGDWSTVHLGGQKCCSLNGVLFENGGSLCLASGTGGGCFNCADGRLENLLCAKLHAEAVGGCHGAVDFDGCKKSADEAYQRCNESF